jgi:para-nitrobenzyl esterase
MRLPNSVDVTASGAREELVPSLTIPRSWLAIGLSIFGALTINAATAKTTSAAVRVEARAATVTTSEGPVSGVRRGNSDWYLGIPYAAAPTGELRWRPPAPSKPWAEPRDASAFRDWCLQVAPEGFSKPIVNEDCLYLNVFTPHETSRAKKRPVMVWIHGGGLRQGRSNDYDPTPMVEKGGVVFVSFNYRLNILGFLAHPALDREGHDFANYGLLDQQYALAWVRRNIAAFGGDPANVTLIGESSGGANVFNHMAAPRSAGLFHKAIIESGSLWYGAFAPFYDGLPLAGAEDVGRAVSTMTGCDGADQASCLRSLSAERLAEVVRKLPSYSFGVVVDGTSLPRSVTRQVLSGNFHRVPVINGSNHDEWTWVEGLSENAAGRPLAEPELKKHLEATFGYFAADAVVHYPVASFGGSAGAASARAVTDGLFMCPLLGLNEVLSRYTQVWGYEFKDTTAPYPFSPASFPYGAAHTLEMQYLFQDYTGAVGARKPLSPTQNRLSDAMVRYWTNFARTGNPNAPNTPAWPALTASSRTYLSLVAPVPKLTGSATIAADHLCDTVWKGTIGQSRLKSPR